MSAFFISVGGPSKPQSSKHCTLNHQSETFLFENERKLIVTARITALDSTVPGKTELHDGAVSVAQRGAQGQHDPEQDQEEKGQQAGVEGLPG